VKSVWKLILISLGLLALIALLTWVLFTFTMPSENLPLSIFIMLLVVGAIIWFSWFVMKPWALWYGKRRAREYCESGQIKDPRTYERLCRRLSASVDKDPEAAHLHQELKKLKDRK